MRTGPCVNLVAGSFSNPLPRNATPIHPLAAEGERVSRSAVSSADAISTRLRDLELLTKGPAWALTRSAPWVIAVLQASFTRTRAQLPLEEFHADVDAFLEQLRRQAPGTGEQQGGASGVTSGRKY